MNLKCYRVDAESRIFTEGREYPVFDTEGIHGQVWLVRDNLGHTRAMHRNEDGEIRFVINHIGPADTPVFAWFITTGESSWKL